MPLENLHLHANSAWAWWRITEDETTLEAQVAPFEPIPPAIHNPQKRLEFLAARVLIKQLLKAWDIPFHGLTKNEHGKPFLQGHTFQVSLSHSYPYVAAVIDRHQPVGIDLEQPKEKLLKIAPRVLDGPELENAGTDIVHHCIYWCAKEALIKIHGKKDLVFAEHIKIAPFQRENQGKLAGRIIVNGNETTILLYYYVFESFVVVLNNPV